MSDGYFTPDEAATAAITLHAAGLNVYVSLRHPSRSGVLYQGDSERAQGRSATVGVEAAHDLPIDEMVKLRTRIRRLGYDAEVEAGNMAILGDWTKP